MKLSLIRAVVVADKENLDWRRSPLRPKTAQWENTIFRLKHGLIFVVAP